MLIEKNKPINIFCGEAEDDAVKIATENLKNDIKTIFDCPAAICREPDKCSIVISTYNNSDFLPENLHYSSLYDCENIRFEAFLHQTLSDVLYIVGADRRGTIFGIYELSGMLGMSPWHFFADVPAKKKTHFSLPDNYMKSDYPSVKYRGIFLNDEEELEAWAKTHTCDGTIGPEIYERIFELLLRLKANYIWPAMHVNYFNQDSRNSKLANTMGIVVGTSHCDMLLRSNQNEWKPWLSSKGLSDIEYDYSIPGKNRDTLHEYWRESVILNKDYDVCYTVGMRGIHDSGFAARFIDSDSSLSESEKKYKKKLMLENVINEQQKIISDVTGKVSSDTLQIFIPYKEVLDMYNDGLNVPEDITLIWVDDNFGYMRRYPDEEERRRKGGNGLYYHSSYWAFPGMSYLFFNSTPLAQTGNELKKCFESGIQKMWVLNIGALKPLEIDMEYFLNYAWEAGKPSIIHIQNTDTFLKNWTERNFSIDDGSKIASVYNKCMQLTNVCKVEHMQTDKFSQDSYGDEGYERLKLLKYYYDSGNEIYRHLPLSEKDAFFQTVLMKIHASYYINSSFYYADRSRICFDRGAFQAADKYTFLSRHTDMKKRQLIYYYNKIMSGGKWDGILTPESFTPPPTALYPACKPALTVGDTGLDLFCEDSSLTFESYGRKEKFFVLYNTGSGEAEFSISAPPWLKLSQTHGFVRDEIRIYVSPSCDFNYTEMHGIISISSPYSHFELPADIKCNHFFTEILCRDSDNIHIEADGYISIPADSFTKKGNGIKIVDGIGRGAGNALETVNENESWIKYSFYTKTSGEFLLEIFRNVTLRPMKQIRFEIQTDDLPPVTVCSEITDEWCGNWRDAVMNNGEKLYIKLPVLNPGIHKLTVRIPDLYTAFSRLVIYCRERKNTNMGAGFFTPLNTHSCDNITDKKIISDVMFQYPETPDYITPLPMLYADRHFRDIDRLYVKSDEKEQRPAPLYLYNYNDDGTKNVFNEFGSGMFAEVNGHISIETEFALENSEYAYITKDTDSGSLWVHTQAETNGGNGLAMMTDGYEKIWHNPSFAPSLNYVINVNTSADYHIWLLVKFDDDRTDSCLLALDGTVQEKDRQYCHGSMFTYSMKQRWNWQELSSMHIPSGIHTLSVIAVKSGLRIDRIYITAGDECPPDDIDFKVSREGRK